MVLVLAEAHVANERLYQGYGPEIIALIGDAAYTELARLCAERAERGLVAPHPASVASNRHAEATHEPASPQ